MNRPLIFEYLDYRAFLKDMYVYRKSRERIFSYRYFSGKAGFASPNFLKLVIDGQRNLSHTSMLKIARGFELKGNERDFFEHLVFMNQAGEHEERNHYYQKMMSVNGHKAIHKIARDSYAYFSKWYYPVIREIIRFRMEGLTAEKIASLLRPRISVAEARTAIKLLLRLNLIRKNAGGMWEQTDQDITTGPEVRSLVVANFHREMLKLADAAIDDVPANERDISGLTLSLSRERFPELKARIVAFRKELLELTGRDQSPDQVVQVNIQLFPLSK
jgi:uncharacterized protein (TIGR02147 family)